MPDQNSYDVVEKNQEKKDQSFFKVPKMDIFEDQNGITMFGDLPGVTKERLNITIDTDHLIIEGEASVNVPPNLQILYGEVRTPTYKRVFGLSDELNRDNISAEINNGVLKLHIPKIDAIKPKKIAVKGV